ncbi:hypothetical protein B0H14DRAFT_2766509, partial [Mycena olivaceomarginata]
MRYTFFVCNGREDGAHTPTSQDARLRHSSRQFCISHSCKLLLWDTYCSLRLNYLLSGDAAYTCGQDPNKQTSFYLTTVPWSDRPLPGYNGGKLQLHFPSIGSFAFIHLGNVVAEENFYSDFSDKAELVKAALLCASVLLGDSLVIYRLWIIWGRHRYIIIFPIFSLACTFIAGFGILYEFTQKGPRLRGTTNVLAQIAPWIATGMILSLFTGISSNILLDISRISVLVTAAIRSTSDSRLMYFLNVFWLVLSAITISGGKSGAGNAEYAVSDTFPAIIGIANLLIHARVGLGWSHDQTSPSKATGNPSKRAVV